MATTPPSWGSREARWQAKQAARAQRDQWRAAARAQKDYYRTYWRGWRRPSFTGPVVLLVIGILALLMETGKLDAVEFWSLVCPLVAAASDCSRFSAPRRALPRLEKPLSRPPFHGRHRLARDPR